MAIVLEALFGEARNLLFGIPSFADHSDILFYILSDLLQDEKNEMVSEGGKESMQRSWNN